MKFPFAAIVLCLVASVQAWSVAGVLSSVNENVNQAKKVAKCNVRAVTNNVHAIAKQAINHVQKITKNTFNSVKGLLSFGTEPSPPALKEQYLQEPVQNDDSEVRFGLADLAEEPEMRDDIIELDESTEHFTEEPVKTEESAKPDEPTQST